MFLVFAKEETDGERDVTHPIPSSPKEGHRYRE